MDQIMGGPALIEVTPLNKSAHVRLGGLRSGAMSFTSFFDAAAGAEHPILSTLPRTDTVATYARGAVVGNPAACINSKQVNYDPTRSNAGDLTLKVDCQSNGYGLEWGIQLTPGLRTDSAATVGAFYDNAAASILGAQAYFQVTAFSGTSVTIDVQSATTSGGSYTTTGMTSQAFTATGFQRVAVTSAATISRYIKVVTTGTFSNAVFSVVVNFNLTAVVF